jgi:drug/metabolite transporter (DMT)-like permease
VAAVLLNPGIVLGLGVYVCGTFFWLLAISRVDLSYAYPIASLNYVLVLIASWWLLGEQLTPTRGVGVLAICAGVWAISRTPPRTYGRTTKRVRPAAAVAPASAGGAAGVNRAGSQAAELSSASLTVGATQ